MKNWPKVMELCYQSWNLINFAHELYQICMFLPALRNQSIDIESPHFRMFVVKRCECKIDKRDGHGKLRNGHGKVMETYFVKSVGILL